MRNATIGKKITKEARQIIYVNAFRSTLEVALLDSKAFNLAIEKAMIKSLSRNHGSNRHGLPVLKTATQPA